MKKGFLRVLALLLALLLAVPALAAEGDVAEQTEETVVSGQADETELPVDSFTEDDPEQSEEPAGDEELPGTPTADDVTLPSADGAFDETEAPRENEVSDGTENPGDSNAPGEGEAPDFAPPFEPIPEPKKPEPPVSDEETDPDDEQTSDKDSDSEDDLGDGSDDSEILFEPEEISEALPDEAPVIQVTVPKNGRIIINPYGLPVAEDGEESAEQIVSQPQQITNYSDVPVTVWASATGSIADESNAVYVSEPPEKNGPDKEIFLYVEFQPDESGWQEGYAGTENQILIAERPTEPQPVLELAEDGDPNSSGLFRLFGELTTFPEDPWCEDDALEVVLTFTFLPEGSDLADSDPEDSAPADAEEANAEAYFEPIFAPDTESEFEAIFEPEDEPQDILQNEELFGPEPEPYPELQPEIAPDNTYEPAADTIPIDWEQIE